MAPSAKQFRDSALLAQLVANKEIAFDQDPEGWFRAYLTVLGNVGWTVQDNGWSDYTAIGTAAEVSEQILPVITAALAPTAAALTIITAAVNALKAWSRQVRGLLFLAARLRRPR